MTSPPSIRGLPYQFRLYQRGNSRSFASQNPDPGVAGTVPTMDRRRLGNSGLLVSEFAIGAMTFGDEADEPATHAMLDRYVEVGGTFIDTADVYAKGRSEEYIGRWLASRSHDDLVIASKARFSTSDDPNDRGAGRRHLSRAIEASLRRLGVEVIDLYQIHAWDADIPVDETLGTLDDLVRQGKVRYVGFQFHRVAVAAFRSHCPSHRVFPNHFAAGAVQPAGSSHRAGAAATGA